MTPTERAERYLSAAPGAVAGQNGHAATFSLAMALVHGFQLPPQTALELLASWNCKCQPPWAPSELQHKIQDAAQARPAKPAGWLLESIDNRKPTAYHPPSPKKFTLPGDFRPLSQAELKHLATLRNLAPEALAMAAERGLAWFGTVKGHSCWLVADARRIVAQARRLDGRPFAKSDGTTCKAHTLAGSRASWPVGAASISERRTIALTEGGPDLLAAFHFAWCENNEDVAPVCLLGASQRIAPEALPLFAGKRIRIFTHRDNAGRQAARRWAQQLDGAGATVDAFQFDGLTRTDGRPVGDLNDLTSISADDFEKQRVLWKILP